MRLSLYSEPLGAHSSVCTDPRLGSSALTAGFASSRMEISIKAWPWLQDGKGGVEVAPTQPCEQAPNKPPQIFLPYPSPHMLWGFGGLW